MQLRSVRWKVVAIYTLVFLLALELMGVYTFIALEEYHLQEYTNQLRSQGELLSGYSEPYLTGKKEIPATLIETFSRSAEAEITLLDAYGRVEASSVSLLSLQQNKLIHEEVTKVLLGNSVSQVKVNSQTGQRYQLVALPVLSGGQVAGALYITGSLEPIYSELGDIQWIMVSGGLIVMLVAFILSIILSRTITEPIQEVTDKAARIALGDFSTEIKLTADDEIGRLGEVFNHMANQLETTLTEISAEKGKVEAIFKQMSDGLIVIDNEGLIMHINPAAIEILNYRLDENESLIGILGEEILTGLFQPEELLASNYDCSREREIEVIQPQGNKMIYKCLLAPFKPPQSKLSGILILIHDVTREKETVRLQQEFVANVSHELRTPLTTIKSYIETLLEGAKEDSATLEHFLTVVNRETERMVRMVKDLLKLSQLDFKQVRWQFTPENMINLLEETVEEARQRCGGERIITLRYSAMPAISIDRDRIKQVLVNLLNNSINYTGERGTINVEAGQQGENIIISIADNGIGIPADETSKVMERFYRVDKTRSRQRGGTGLGLTIAMEIIEGHGGHIWIESNQGEGTTVYVKLPLSKNMERGKR